MPRTLVLTSPHLHGADVARCQRELALPRFGPFYEGVPDGEYGPVTAGAVREAKYMLGWLEAEVEDGYVPGGPLSKQLTGKAPLTEEQKTRRRRRLKQQSELDLGARAVVLGLPFVGTKEKPAGSNRVIFSVRYPPAAPWCAKMVTCLLVDAGSKDWVIGEFSQYCPYVEQAARNAERGLRVVARQEAFENPQTGLILLFDWGVGDGVSDHIGFMVAEGFLQARAPELLAEAKRVHGKLRAGETWTLEGNTSLGNASDGGQVAIMKRKQSQVRLACRATR